MALLEYSLNRTAAPASEPVTTAEAKAHLRVGHANDDTYIDDLIQAAREAVEKDARIALFTQTWAEKFHAFPDSSQNCFSLTKWPLASVTSIQYIDTNGTTQTWASSKYNVDTAREPGVVWLVYNETWPSTRAEPNAVTVTYVAGYATTALIPQVAKQAVLYLVAHMYEERQPVVEQSLRLMDLTYSAMLDKIHPQTYP